MIVRNNFYVCDIKIDISLGAAFLTVYNENEDVSFHKRRSWFNTRVCVKYRYKLGSESRIRGWNGTSTRTKFLTKMSLQNFPHIYRLVDCVVFFFFLLLSFSISVFFFVYNVRFIFVTVDSHNIFEINILGFSWLRRLLDCAMLFIIYTESLGALMNVAPVFTRTL